MESTKKTSRCFAIVPAAGYSARMGGAVPKQYIKINRLPILAYSVNVLSQEHAIEQIFIPVNENDENIEDLPFQHPEKIFFTTGGACRLDSVINAMKALASVANEGDWVLVHDAVRPCLHSEDLQSLIAQCMQHEVGGLLGCPVKDTLKQVHENGEVVATIDRKTLWHALTPQMFRFGILQRALALAQSRKLPVTDEAGAIEALGLKPLMVAAMHPNPKLTYPMDRQIISHLLSSSLTTPSFEEESVLP